MSYLAMKDDLLKDGTQSELVRTAECRAKSDDGHFATVIVIVNWRDSGREFDLVVEVMQETHVAEVSALGFGPCQVTFHLRKGSSMMRFIDNDQLRSPWIEFAQALDVVESLISTNCTRIQLVSGVGVMTKLTYQQSC